MHARWKALVHLILGCLAHRVSLGKAESMAASGNIPAQTTEPILECVSTGASWDVPASSRLVSAVACKAIPDRYEGTFYMPFDKTRPAPRICRLGRLNLLSSSIGAALD